MGETAIPNWVCHFPKLLRGMSFEYGEYVCQIDKFWAAGMCPKEALPSRPKVQRTLIDLIIISFW